VSPAVLTAAMSSLLAESQRLLDQRRQNFNADGATFCRFLTRFNEAGGVVDWTVQKAAAATDLS